MHDDAKGPIDQIYKDGEAEQTCGCYNGGDRRERGSPSTRTYILTTRQLVGSTHLWSSHGNGTRPSPINIFIIIIIMTAAWQWHGNVLTFPKQDGTVHAPTRPPTQLASTRFSVL